MTAAGAYFLSEELFFNRNKEKEDKVSIISTRFSLLINLDATVQLNIQINALTAQSVTQLACTTNLPLSVDSQSAMLEN